MSGCNTPSEMRTRASVTGKVKRRGPALPGLRNKTSSRDLDRRLVRMTVNDGGEARGSRIEVEFCDVVQEIELVIAGGDDRGRRQARRPRPGIDVATNRERRSNASELFDQAGRSDVAGMDDQIGPTQFREGLRPY